MGTVTFATPEQLTALKEPRAPNRTAEFNAPNRAEAPLHALATVALSIGQPATVTAQAPAGSLEAAYLGLSELAQRSSEADAATIRGALKWLEHLKYAADLPW